jgi:hypothetical protein
MISEMIVLRGSERGRELLRERRHILLYSVSRVANRRLETGFLENDQDEMFELLLRIEMRVASEIYCREPIAGVEQKV